MRVTSNGSFAIGVIARNPLAAPTPMGSPVMLGLRASYFPRIAEFGRCWHGSGKIEWLGSAMSLTWGLKRLRRAALLWFVWSCGI